MKCVRQFNLCWFLFSSVIVLFSCSPTQIINVKERVIERNAPPRPAIHVDRFLYGKINGPVDVLFVVDNTESIEAGISQFEKSYLNFLALWKTEDARSLHYRNQVATTPRGRTPKNFLANELEVHLHLAELFDGYSEGPENDIPFFTQRTDGDFREKGYPDPIASTIAGLNHDAFKGRQRLPLFLVYILGHDIDPSIPKEALSKSVEEAKKALEESRGFFQTHVMALTRTSSGGGSFPHCNEFSQTPRFLELLSSFPWASFTKVDLCEKDWSNWEQQLFLAVLNFKRRLVLSQPPHEPSTMTLRSATHLYRYGDDYEVDAKTNEISFKVDPDLAQGDLLEASYFLKPPPPEFSGSPTPGTTVPIGR